MIDPLYVFVFAGLFTPGPNVILLTASGARFGFRASLPHVLGVAAGVGVTAGLTGFGIGAVLLGVPQLTLVLKLMAFGWILWMAFQLARRARRPQASGSDRPFTFVEAVLFQWVNPKIWVIALAAASGYGAGLSPGGEAMRLAATFSGINLFVCLFWTKAGDLLTVLLTTPTRWAFFLRGMAAFLAISGLMVFL